MTMELTMKNNTTYTPAGLSYAEKKTYNADFFSILTNKRRLLAQLKFITNSEQIETLLGIFKEVTKVRLDLLKKIEAEEAEKLAKIETFKKMLEEEGLTIPDLLGNSGEILNSVEAVSQKQFVKTPDGRKMDASKPIRYKFPSEDGQECPWHGSGRVPNRLKDLMKEGHTLDDFRIS